MNPIWEMDEHASVLFKFTDSSARSAPSKHGHKPQCSEEKPQFPSGKEQPPVITMIPNTPAFVSIPDKAHWPGRRHRMGLGKPDMEESSLP